MKLNTALELIEDIRLGKMVILVDDEDRENEGDIIVAADYVTPQLVNFMATEARGLICLSLTSEQIDRLDLPLMVKSGQNKSANHTAFTVSIEASRGVSTGISAADRAHTIKVAANPAAIASDVIVPGHIFPLRAQDGGVLKRAGHTEASVDLARMAGLNPAAVICEIMNSDGSMSRMPELLEFAKRHQIKIGTIEDLIEYRLETETFVKLILERDFISPLSKNLRLLVFKNQLDGREHLVFVSGDISQSVSVPVRVHLESALGDVFLDQESDSRSAITHSFEYFEKKGCGVFVYLKSSSQTLGPTPGVVDERDYGVGAQILRALGLNKISLLTHSPTKRVGIKGYGLEVTETILLENEIKKLQSISNQEAQL